MASTKAPVDEVTNLQNNPAAIAKINANDDTLSDAIGRSLSRTAETDSEGDPIDNAMDVNLDMDGHRISNLPLPVADDEPARKGEVDDLISTVEEFADDAEASAEAAAASASSASSSASAASSSASAAATAKTNAETAETNAETAETNAETAETNAETAQAAAETARDVAINQASAGLYFTFSTTTSMADPGAGILRLNNASPASATAIAIDDTTANSGNPDVSARIVTWDDSSSTIKGTLTVYKRGAAGTFATYSVTGLTDNSGWTELAVTYVAGNGTFSASDGIDVVFNRTGDKGLTGDTGATGPGGEGSGDASGPGVSIDSEIALWDGTSGQLLKRATTTGIVKATSGVISAAAAGTDYLAPAAIGTTVQAFDTDLSTIAGLTATTDSFLQAKSSAWAARTIAQVRTDLDGQWQEIGTFTYASNVTQVQFTGLAGFSDVMVIARAITTGSSGARFIQVSSDNGSSYYSASGDYVQIATTGVETAGTGLSCIDTASASARSFVCRIHGFGVATMKYCDITRTPADGHRIITQAVAMTALRVFIDDIINITGGTIKVYGKR